jgi:hypothetical protein
MSLVFAEVAEELGIAQDFEPIDECNQLITSQSTAKRTYQNLDNEPQTDNNLSLQSLGVHSTCLVQRTILAELIDTTV